MAATTKKTASKKSTKKTTASTAPARKRTSTKKTPTKKATGATSTSPAARKTTRKRTSSAASAPLFEREPVAILETAGYAATSLLNDVVTLARNPERLEVSLGTVRERLGKDLERTLASFTRAVDHRAAAGRKVVQVVVKDDRVSRVLDQTSATRSQLKAALTSVTKTADVAADAAGKQADTARSQIKGATTTVRNSSGQARSQVKGAATSVRKIADAAYSAASKQAPTAASQVRGAATSVRKSAGTVVEATLDTAADAEAETRS